MPNSFSIAEASIIKGASYWYNISITSFTKGLKMPIKDKINLPAVLAFNSYPSCLAIMSTISCYVYAFPEGTCHALPNALSLVPAIASAFPKSFT